MSQFHNLKVVDIKNETSDTVSVAFEIPESDKSSFEYISGQYLTLKVDINGKEERRSYSMCSSPFAGEEMRIAVKRVENGLVSNFINDSIKIGDRIEVMPPQGNFILETSKEQKTYVGFVAGSGITPVWSMIKSVLQNEPLSKFILFYGNKTSESTIFKNDIDSLVGDRLIVHHILSREETGNTVLSGRINETKAIELLNSDLDLLKAHCYFMCGPEEMIFSVRNALQGLGVSDDKIKYELFTTPVLFAEEKEVVISEFKGMAKVKVIYDDEEVEFDLDSDGDNVLDVAMKHDVDAPFSCKGAVCCTCKAKVTQGRMTMDANYALSDEEVAEGFVLACQAHPASENVTLDFDEA